MTFSPMSTLHRWFRAGRLAPPCTTAVMATVTVAAMAAAGAGCSTTPVRAATFPANYNVVGVPMIENQTYDRKVAAELTEAVVKSIEAQTPYRVVRAGNADLVLRATVTKVELRVLSKNRVTGLPGEMAYKLTIDFDWIEQDTGKVFVQRHGFVKSAMFVPSLPSQEPEDIGRFGAVENMADDIVASLQGEW